MSKRDEYSCPCCGTPTDGWYCVACDAFECGERDVTDAEPCLVPAGVAVARERHAAHYEGNGRKGHDLFYVTFAGETNSRPANLPPDATYLQGFSANGKQQWQYVRPAPLSPGRCPRCP